MKSNVSAGVSQNDGGWKIGGSDTKEHRSQAWRVAPVGEQRMEDDEMRSQISHQAGQQIWKKRRENPCQQLWWRVRETLPYNPPFIFTSLLYYVVLLEVELSLSSAVTILNTSTAPVTGYTFNLSGEEKKKEKKNAS